LETKYNWTESDHKTVGINDINKKYIENKTPYLIYQVKHPFIRQYDEQYWKTTDFKKWTETRFFTPN